MFFVVPSSAISGCRGFDIIGGRRGAGDPLRLVEAGAWGRLESRDVAATTASCTAERGSGSRGCGGYDRIVHGWERLWEPGMGRPETAAPTKAS